MKLIPLLLALTLISQIAIAGEEHGEGEHGHKPPPAPSKGTPVGDVFHLPVVDGWRKTVEDRKGQFSVWGEYLTSINGQPYSRVAVGPTIAGSMQVWKHFCVPQLGGDILVVSESSEPGGDATYIPYEDWVSKCKPTKASGGSC